MNTFCFNAVINQTTGKQLSGILDSIMEQGESKHKIRIVGEELTFENESWELYFYNNSPENITETSEGESFLGNGSFNGQQKEFDHFIQQLSDQLQSNNLEFEIEYFLENEDGDQIGESETIRSAGF